MKIDKAIQELQLQLQQNQFDNLYQTADKIYDKALRDYNSGDLDQSQETIEKVLDILNQTEESIAVRQKGHFNNLLGNIMSRRGDIRSALAYELEAAEQLLQANQIFDITDIYKHCGVLLFYLGDSGSSYEYLQKALNLAKELDQHAEKAWIQLNIGGLLKRNKKYSEALEIEQEAESIFRTQEDDLGLAFILNSIGASQFRLGHFEESLDNHRKSMELMKKLDNSRGLLTVAKAISQPLCSMGKPEEALSICREILDIAGGSNWPQIETQIYLRCAVAELELNKHDDALETLNKVEGILNHVRGHLGSKSHLAKLQAEVYKAQGKHEHAFGALVEHVELAEEFAIQSKNEKLSRLRIAAEVKATIREKKMLAENKLKLEKSNAELREALARTKTLRGMLPICSNCKRIRTDEGYWAEIENYVSQHSDLLFSHGLCPECKTIVE